FIFSQTGEMLTLCIDGAFAGLNRDKGEPLFVEGKPSAFTRQVVASCRSYQDGHTLTTAFVKELKRLDLLVPVEAALQRRTDETKRVGGFRVVDHQRWTKVADDDILALRRRGWLEPIVLHLASQANWDVILTAMA
ncbi:MAG: SapC family protein, partial [Alphaproteobacteria bacterium]|nr:SapC family protein [Alphaproteobacteria bacterium]